MLNFLVAISILGSTFISQNPGVYIAETEVTYTNRCSYEINFGFSSTQTYVYEPLHLDPIYFVLDSYVNYTIHGQFFYNYDSNVTDYLKLGQVNHDVFYDVSEYVSIRVQYCGYFTSTDITTAIYQTGVTRSEFEYSDLLPFLDTVSYSNSTNFINSSLQGMSINLVGFSGTDTLFTNTDVCNVRSIYNAYPTLSNYTSVSNMFAVQGTSVVIGEEFNNFINSNVYGSYDAGFTNGFNRGYDDGYSEGSFDGYQEGYESGFNEGISTDTTAHTIFNGILNVALVPINFFLAIFDFTVLGINIKDLVAALLTVCIVVIILRVVFGHKGDD